MVVAACPVCGKEFDRETKEKAENSVIGHMSRSKGDHEGIGFGRARAMLDAGNTVNGDNGDNSDIPETNTEAGEEPERGIDTGDPDSNEEGGGVPPEEDITTCPRCGADLGTAEELRAMGKFKCGECDPQGLRPLGWSE